MDPRGQTLKRHATHMLQFKPGRDVAMLSALLQRSSSEGLYDRQYVQAHTDDFEKLAESVKDHTPEKMAPICGIDAGDAAPSSRANTPAPRRRSSSGAWASRSMSTAPTMRAA